MVGVLIQTMPMLSLVLGAQSCCVGLGGMCQVPPLVWILLCPARTELVPSSLPECQRWRGHSHVTSAPAVPVDLQGDFPWDPSASLLSPAQWVAGGLGSSQEHSCRQQGHPGSYGNDAKVLCLPSGILEPLGMQGREAELTWPVSPVGKWLRSLCLVAGPQCHSSVQLDMGIARKEHSSYKLFLVLWRVQSRDCQIVRGCKHREPLDTKTEQFHESTLNLPNYKSLGTMHTNSVCNSFFLWNNL